MNENRKNIIRSSNNSKIIFPVLFLILHIPFGYLASQFSIIATIHAIVTIFIGLFFSVNDKKPSRVIYVVSYITASEILWRVCNAQVFWEIGKYSVSLLLIILILKFYKIKNISKLPIFYFLLLLPAILVTPYFSREEIAFNLAGPFALAVSVIFFQKIVLNIRNLRNIFISIIAPSLSLAFIALEGILRNPNITFSSGSNFQTSAGFGPNQVSSILALGCLSAFYLVIIEKRFQIKIFFILVSVWLLVQSMLTFSRGGLWTTLGAIIFVSYYLLKSKKSRTRFILILAILFALGNFFIFPTLDNLTNYKFSARFKNLEPTGRIEIAIADLIAFRENPVFGAGIQQSKNYHSITFRYSSAHLEYSRMLAEHGLFGLISLIILMVLVINRFKMKNPNLNKAITIGLTIWALLYMSHAATRLVAPSFIFGMSAAKLYIDQNL